MSLFRVSPAVVSPPTDAPRLFRPHSGTGGRCAAGHGAIPRRGPRLLVLGLAVLLGGAGSAELRGVASACQEDAARFCAAQTEGMAPGRAADGRDGEAQAMDGRDTLICLRPYRTSVTLMCRRALSAVAASAAAVPTQGH